MTDPEIPDTRSLPQFMLQAGDMTFHSGHRWFYEAPANACPSSHMYGETNPDGEYLVAVDPEAARAYNTARRAARMAGA